MASSATHCGNLATSAHTSTRASTEALCPYEQVPVRLPRMIYEYTCGTVERGLHTDVRAHPLYSCSPGSFVGKDYAYSTRASPRVLVTLRVHVQVTDVLPQAYYWYRYSSSVSASESQTKSSPPFAFPCLTGKKPTSPQCQMPDSNMIDRFQGTHGSASICARFQHHQNLIRLLPTESHPESYAILHLPYNPSSIRLPNGIKSFRDFYRSPVPRKRAKRSQAQHSTSGAPLRASTPATVIRQQTPRPTSHAQPFGDQHTSTAFTHHASRLHDGLGLRPGRIAGSHLTSTIEDQGPSCQLDDDGDD